MITKTHEIHELEPVKINSSNKDEFEIHILEAIKKILSQIKSEDSSIICVVDTIEVLKPF